MSIGTGLGIVTVVRMQPWLVRLSVSLADAEIMTAALWDLGTTGVAEIPSPSRPEACDLIAGFSDEAAATAASEAIQTSKAAVPWPDFQTVSIEPVSQWQTPDPVVLTHSGHEIALDIGTAFGHGAHPTTAMALDLVADLAPGRTVLDVGTGTGVLAILAALQDARAVSATDNDPAAVAVARSNALTNNVDVEIMADSDLADGQKFDLVVLNMLLADLAPIVQDVAAWVDQDGLLAVTGFLASDRRRLLALFPHFETAQVFQASEWEAVVLKRRTPPAISPVGGQQ